MYHKGGRWLCVERLWGRHQESPLQINQFIIHWLDLDVPKHTNHHVSVIKANKQQQRPNKKKDSIKLGKSGYSSEIEKNLCKGKEKEFCFMTHYLLVETLILNYLRTLRKNKPLNFLFFTFSSLFKEDLFYFPYQIQRKIY